MTVVSCSPAASLPNVLAFYGEGEQLLGQALAKFFSSTAISAVPSELCKIMTAHGSDKGSGWHNYTLLYSILFRERRSQVRSVFELGIGTNFTDVRSNMGERGRPGASLRGWRDYFRGAQVVGADVDRRVLFSEERIMTFFVDQTNEEAIEILWRSVPDDAFDLMVDDGLHTFEASSLFMQRSFDKLRKGGLYIIEDIATDYKNLKDFHDFFQRCGLSGTLVSLPNPNNKLDSCLAVFLAQTNDAHHENKSVRLRNEEERKHVNLFDQISQAAQASQKRKWNEF